MGEGGAARGRALRRTATTFLTGWTLASCGSGGAAPEVETIPRETFVETYVALRTVGLRAPQQLLSEEDRRRILSEEGVSQEDLFTFVEVHGKDVEYMRDVWNEIEERLNELRASPDSSEDRS